jgi:hypothetical protein
VVALLQFALDQLLLDQFELLQFELDQFELLQFELDQLELDQLLLDQFELAQFESLCAVVCHVAASKTGAPVASVVMNCSRAAFGFGGSIPATAPAASISPTPSENEAAEVALALAISAPLTWSGVYSGWAARMCAAVPETTAVAIEVPESCM